MNKNYTTLNHLPKKRRETFIYIYIYISCNPASDKLNENIGLPKQTKNKRKKGLMAIIYLNYG